MNDIIDLGSAYTTDDKQTITLNSKVALGKYNPSTDLTGVDVDSSDSYATGSYGTNSNSEQVETPIYSETVSIKSSGTESQISDNNILTQSAFNRSSTLPASEQQLGTEQQTEQQTERNIEHKNRSRAHNPNKPFIDLFKHIIKAWSDFLRSFVDKTPMRTALTKNNNFYYIILSIVVIFILSILIDYFFDDSTVMSQSKPLTLIDSITGLKYTLSAT